jgi:hypothetical protein
MQAAKHTAARVMAYPFNHQLIKEYAAWEKANAVKQIEELQWSIKEHRARPQTPMNPTLKK